MSEQFDWEQKKTIQKAAAQAHTGSLPRVLILGDSISLGYTPFVADMMKDQAFVTRPSTNCGPSENYLPRLDSWLGTEKWDVIHVNFGIWDNHYMTPDWEIFHTTEEEIKNFTCEEDYLNFYREKGVRLRTSEPEYEANMRKILRELKGHSSKVIFALTTPMPLWRKDGRIKRIPVYNDIARKVCAETGVEINDLYTVILPHLDLQTDGCHFRDEGYIILAEAVSGKIRTALSTI